MSTTVRGFVRDIRATLLDGDSVTPLPRVLDVEQHLDYLKNRTLPGLDDFSVKNVMKCCVEFLIPDGRMIPFCAYNSVGYREAVTASLMSRQARPSVETIPTHAHEPEWGCQSDPVAVAAGQSEVS